ncbi:MAG TPA: 5-formyltetrahydrofolate cyclo-ligase [Actinomycetota bacterium]|nr:5-formyltetrahydrofolate cyclo-ligase [Actinomycetota bacterium]
MTSNELKRAKRAIRRQVLTARDAIPPAELVAGGEAVADAIAGLSEVSAGTVVMSYWAFGSEVPTAPLHRRLWAAGVTVALPRIEDGELRILVYRDGDPLTTTGFGALEPAPDASPVAATDLDVIATPGVAFDREGRRIGYGGGFYDRLFPRAPGALRIGVAHDLQVLDGPLPAGHFDLRVQAICTPTVLRRLAAPT